MAGATETCRRWLGIGTRSDSWVSVPCSSSNLGTAADGTWMYQVSRWASASAYWSGKLSISSTVAKYAHASS